MARGYAKSAWGWSIGLHAVLIVLALLAYRNLRQSEDERIVGLVNTKLGDFGVMELRIDEPSTPSPAPPAPTPAPSPSEAVELPPVVTAEKPVVAPPMLDPVETFPVRPGDTRVNPRASAPLASGASNGPASASVTPNRGKGSPVHPGGVQAGKSIVYVLDCSASMGRGGRLNEASTAILASLEQLTPEVHFQIVLYHSFAERLSIAGSSDLVPATAENKQIVREQLARLSAEGQSKHIEGLRRALLLKPSAIFLLTDADDLGEDQLITIGLLNQSHTVIYPILFGQKDRLTRSTPLDKLAEASRGRVIPRE